MQGSPRRRNWAPGALLSLHGLRQLGAREQSGLRKGQDRVWAPGLPRHPLLGTLLGTEASRGHSCEMVSWQVSSWPHAAETPRDSTLAGWMMLTVHTYISARTEISFLFVIIIIGTCTLYPGRR